MSRLIRNTVITAKIETTYATDAAPTGAANAMLVSDMSINVLEAQNVSRDLVRGYFGGSEQLVGTANKRVGFTIELAGSGTKSVAPAFAPLLLACGMEQKTITPSGGTAHIEFWPVSTAIPSVTIYYYDDGALHKLLGARGNVTLNAKAGERPTLVFDFVGIDGGDTAVTNATPVFSSWKKPVTMTMANTTQDFTLACDLEDGDLDGGTIYPSTGLTLNFNNAVNFAPMLSKETVELTQRDIGGNVELELTAAQEVALLADIKANASKSIGFHIGNVTGNSVIVYAPNVQFINPTKTELNGKRMCGYDLRFMPSAGNDDLVLAFI